MADVALGIIKRYQRGERAELGRMLAAADPATLFGTAAMLSKLIDGEGLAELHHLIMMEVAPPAPASEITPMTRIAREVG